MLQLLCTTSKANSLNDNTSTSTRFFICMPEKSNYGYAASNIVHVATIVIINGPGSATISQKVQ